MSRAACPQARRQRGIAAVELALLMPMLVVLLLCAVDGARALQANIIMTNIGREGANLAARGSIDLDEGSQDIMHAVMASAPPLDVNRLGMVYITRVMGVVTNGVSRSVVLDQFRWDDAARNLGARRNNYRPASRVYNCGAWASTGKCASISASLAPNLRPAAPIMAGRLDDGEVVFVVETFYRFDMIVSAFTAGTSELPTFGPDLYSMTVF